jgi:thiamine biosynthesis lipoprotein ApbE
MVADALSTAALAMGRADGETFLERHEARALLVTTALACSHTRAWAPAVT